MRSSTRLIILIVALALAGAALAAAVTFGLRRGTAVAATVNGEVIYASDLNREVAAIARQYGINLAGQDGGTQRAELARIVLDQMIEQRLILQEARKHNATATEAQVDAQLAEIRRTFASESEFAGALAQRGMTLQNLRERLRTNLTVRSLMEKVIPARVTDAEVQRYFQTRRREFDTPEQVRVRHILLESEAEARLLLARLRRGEDFAALARAHSKDPGSREQGGDLGFVKRGTLVAEFERTAFALKPREISGIVKTQFGYHIIQLIDRRAPQPADFAAVKEQIRAQLLSQRREAAFQEWLKQVKAGARIQRHDLPTR